MGGKRRKSKKHKQHRPARNVDAAAIGVPQSAPSSSFSGDGKYGFFDGGNPERRQEQQMNDTIVGYPSAVVVPDSEPWHLRPKDGVEDLTLIEQERVDHLAPFSGIVTAVSSTQEMEIDAQPVPPLVNGDQACAASQVSEPNVPLIHTDSSEGDEDETSNFWPNTSYTRVYSRYQTERPHDLETLASSRSLWAEDLDYFEENGRRYCGKYFMPNDEEEQDRLRIIHQVYLSICDFELTTVELEDPTYILDIGTGIGEWAIGMGELYTECEVVGTDISAIQPSGVPLNVFFEIDDAELEWMRPENSADLIHFRHMGGAFADWKFVYQQAFNTCKPGGYIEILDFDDQQGLKTFLSFFPPDHEMVHFVQDLVIASQRSGRPRGMAHMDQRMLIDIGFVDVTSTEFSVPLSPNEMTVGKLWLVACLCSLEALSLRLLTRYMGWSADEVRHACDIVALEIKHMALEEPEKASQMITKMRVLVGRKPEEPGHWTAQSLHENSIMPHESTGEESGALESGENSEAGFHTGPA